MTNAERELKQAHLAMDNAIAKIGTCRVYSKAYDKAETAFLKACAKARFWAQAVSTAQEFDKWRRLNRKGDNGKAKMPTIPGIIKGGR